MSERPQVTETPRVVALVTSEGGLHALGTILSELPGDFPAVLIALQHQAPTHESISTRFEMPSAAINRDEVVDIVVPLDEVAPLLCKLVGTSGADSESAAPT